MLLLVLVQNSRVTHYNTNILASLSHHISNNINASTVMITNANFHTSTSLV